MNQLVPFRTGAPAPALIAAAGSHARERFIEFFTANILDRNTRRAYAQAAPMGTATFGPCCGTVFQVMP